MSKTPYFDSLLEVNWEKTDPIKITGKVIIKKLGAYQRYFNASSKLQDKRYKSHPIDLNAKKNAARISSQALERLSKETEIAFNHKYPEDKNY
jgi:hypothetical protein